MTRRPVHDRDQIQKAALNGDVGDVGTPHVIGSFDRHSFEKIGINSVRRMRHAGPRRLVNGLQPHQAHQTPNPVATDANAVAPQLARHLAGTLKRILQKQLVDPTHQRQILRTFALPGVIE